MPDVDSRPHFVLYVDWHTDFKFGGRTYAALRCHWSTDPDRQIVGGGGIDMLPRHVREPGAMPPTDWDASRAAAVIVLMDRLLAGQAPWIDYVRGLAAEAEARGFACRIYPVAMEEANLFADINPDIKLHTFDEWARSRA